MRHKLLEFGRFATVGAANVLLDVAVFNVLRLVVIEHKPLTAKGVSTAVAAVSSYFMNRHWTWRERARTGVRRELPLFVGLSAIGLGLTEACLAVSHYGLGLTSALADNIAANVVGLGVGMAWRFWAFRRWVFLPSDPV